MTVHGFVMEEPRISFAKALVVKSPEASSTGRPTQRDKAAQNSLSPRPPPPSPVRYAKFESIRYFIDIDILQNCRIDIDIDIDIFQNHHINIDIDIDIFGITLSISISISIFFRIALSISIFSTSPYRYRYFSKVSIYRQSICHIDIANRAMPGSGHLDD